jgi:SAM-dependent methyltransferase
MALAVAFTRAMADEVAGAPDGLWQSSFQEYCRRLVKGEARDTTLVASARRLVPLVRVASALPRGSMAVDIGCGVGTEVILLGALGLRAVGVDLKSNRLEHARRRVSYWTQVVGRPIDVDFVGEDVFGFLRRGGMRGASLVYVKEALSHVHPAEDFIAMIGDVLEPPAQVMIVESNPTNPAVAVGHIREWKGFRYAVTRDHVDPRSGAVVPYAHERTFAPGHLGGLLAREGFEVESLEFGGFVGGSVLPERAMDVLGRPLLGLDSALRRMPVIRRLGGYYCLQARRA